MDNQLALVTGGAGFIGAELVRKLAQRGFRVRAVDNLVGGKRENLSDVTGNRVELVAADIRDEAAMATLVPGVDVIFHLACLGVRHSFNSPAENHAVNASATLGLLKIARASGVNRFVYVSSSDVYGKTQQVPISEQHPTLPTSVYGASKLAGEAYTRAFWETYRYPTVVARAFTTYGPGCKTYGDHVIPQFMARCMAGEETVISSDAAQTHDFTYVSDMAEGILAAGLSQDCVGQTLNFGTGNAIPVCELAVRIAEVLGKTGAEITHAEPLGAGLPVVADISKAQQLLGFQPTVSLSEGLSRLRDWYLSQSKAAAELIEGETERISESRNVPSHA